MVMGFLDTFKARKGLNFHQNGRFDEALAIYEELYNKGVMASMYMLPYTVLLLRNAKTEEDFLKVKEVLRKAEKAPDLTPDKRQQLLMHYAVAQYKLGEMEKALHLLEAAHQKSPCGIIYGTLGFLYIQAGDAEKALSYNLEALEYDDEDAVTLDNLGQVHYRLLNDKETARGYFEKAIEIKEGQIDTLYFLSRYDLEEGKTEAAVAKLEKALEGRFSPLNYVSREEIEKEIERLKA